MKEDENTLAKKIKFLELEILRDTNDVDLDFHVYELSQLNKELKKLKDKS